MEFKKTTCGFTKNDRSFYQKRRVVLHKTTSCFYSIDGSFFFDYFFLSRTAGKRHEKRPQQDAKTPFFSTIFAKHTFQSSGTNHKKRCISPQKWSKKGAFFLFLWFFAPTSKKNNRIISQTLGFYLTLGWKYTTVTHKALAIPALLAFFPTTLVYRNTIP